MIRGVRGATTVTENKAESMIENTKILVEEMVNTNNIEPTEIAQVLISVTSDLNAGFPAKGLRLLDGWTYVPVMCMKEIDVPNSLAKCIRVMMTINTDKQQHEIIHIYHNEAKKLRPDLASTSD